MKSHSKYLSFLFLWSTFQTHALPIDPQYKDVPIDISFEARSSFVFYADTQSDAVIWYLPKTAGIAANLSHFDRPHLTIQTAPGVVNQGDAYQDEYEFMAGVFDLRGQHTELQALKKEHPGYAFKPVKFSIEQAYIITEGLDARNLDVHCEDGQFYCYHYDHRNQKRMLQHVIHLQSRHTKTSQTPYFSFEAHFAPHTSYDLKALMAYDLSSDDPSTGQLWSHFFSGYIDIKYPLYTLHQKLSQVVPSDMTLSIDCIQGGWGRAVHWVENDDCASRVQTDTKILNLNPQKNLNTQIKALDALNKEEAIERVNWSEKCGYIQNRDMKFMLTTVKNYKRVMRRSPFYPTYLNANKSLLWRAPILASEDCTKPAKENFGVHSYLKTQ